MKLRKDIVNSIYHILGFHNQCRTDQTYKKITQMTMTKVTIFRDDQINRTKIPNDKELEKSLFTGRNFCTLSETKGLITDIQIALNRIAEKSGRVI